MNLKQLGENMCLEDVLIKLQIKDMKVRFYTSIYMGVGGEYESVKFMTKDYDITDIPKILKSLKYDKCKITNGLIKVYLH